LLARRRRLISEIIESEMSRKPKPSKYMDLVADIHSVDN
jgi:hypothetical protein